MEKVKITQEQADSIKDCLKFTTAEALLKAHRFEDRLPKILNQMDFDRLVIAIFIGYEIMQSPEEMVREYYKDIAISHGSYTREDVTGIIKNILNYLNIKIEGIN